MILYLNISSSSFIVLGGQPVSRVLYRLRPKAQPAAVIHLG